MEKLEAAKITGNKIRVYRKNKKLKQSDLAKMVGTTTASVSRWERGEVQIPLEQAKNVASALEIDLSDLFDIAPSHMPIMLDQDASNHLVALAISDIDSIMTDYIGRIQNRITSICSSEKIDVETMKFVSKTPEEKLTKEQINSLQYVMSDIHALGVRADAAIKYWFETLDKSLNGSGDIKSDDELRMESYFCQGRAEMEAFEKRQKETAPDSKDQNKEKSGSLDNTEEKKNATSYKQGTQRSQPL